MKSTHFFYTFCLVTIMLISPSCHQKLSIGIPVVQALRPVTDLPLDVHLMIDRPIRYVEDFIKAGADWLTIHVEADQPQNILDTLDKIRELGCKPAISLKPRTPAEVAIPYLEKCDMILVMTVEPGFGGQKFMPSSIAKCEYLNKKKQELGLSELKNVKVIDTYEKDGVKSMTVRLVFAAMDRTLEMDEVQGWIDTILENLSKINVALKK